MKRAVTLVLSLLFVSLYLTAQTVTEMKQQFLKVGIGNWYEPNSNSWDYGFFEEFAIHDGAFWSYTTVKKRKNGYVLVLANEMGDEKKLEVFQEGNTLRIKDGKNKPVAYHKVDRFLPAYTTTDTTSFIDTKFSRVDTATIVGYLRNNVSNDAFEIGVPDIFTTELEYYYADLDEWGRFEVKVPLINTARVNLDWKRSGIEAVLTPGESLFIYIDLKDKETLYFGENERFHNELVAYWDYIDKRQKVKSDHEWDLEYRHQKRLKGDDYLNFKLAVLDSLLDVNQFFLTSTSVATRTATYIKERARYRIASDLMQKRFDLNEKIGERFSDHYINTVKTLFFDNNVKPVTLVVDNRTFIRDFLQYYLSDEKINDERGVIHDDIKLEFVSSGIIPIRDEIKALFKLEKRENDLDFSETDSLSLQEMYRDSVLMKEAGMILTEYRDMMQRLTMARLFLLQPLDILCRDFLKDEQLIDVFFFWTYFRVSKK